MTKLLALLIALVVIVVTAAVVSLVTAFGVMLALGAAHSFDPSVPAFGYWATFFLTLAASLAVSRPTVSSSD